MKAYEKIEGIKGNKLSSLNPKIRKSLLDRRDYNMRKSTFKLSNKVNDQRALIYI